MGNEKSDSRNNSGFVASHWPLTFPLLGGGQMPDFCGRLSTGFASVIRCGPEAIRTAYELL